MEGKRKEEEKENVGLRPVRPFKPGDFTILGYARRNLPLRKVAGRTQKAYVPFRPSDFTQFVNQFAAKLHNKSKCSTELSKYLDS